MCVISVYLRVLFQIRYIIKINTITSYRKLKKKATLYDCKLVATIVNDILKPVKTPLNSEHKWSLTP